MDEQQQEEALPLETFDAESGSFTDDYGDAVPQLQMEQPQPQPQQAPRRRGGRPALTPQQQKHAASADKDLDEYLSSFNWEQPGMIVKLHRTAPMWWKGTQSGGHLETRNAPYTLQEVQERWGGGSYKLYLTGPRNPGEPGRPLGSKAFTVAGEPKGALADPSATTHGGGHHGTAANGDSLAPQAQAGIVGLLGRSQDRVLEMMERGRGGSGGDVDPSLFSEMRETIVGSAQAQVEAIKQASDRENNSLREQLNALREETQRVRAENDARKTEMERSMENASRESTSLIGTLIPVMSNQAHERAQAAVHDAHERVRAIQEQYSRDIQAAELRYAQQVDNLKTLYAAQDMNQRTMYEGRVRQLEGEIMLLRTRCEHLDGDNRALQGRVTETLVAQAQRQDLGSQLKQFSMLKEVAGTVFGGGNEAVSEDGLSDGAADWQRMVAKFAPTLNAVAGGIAARFAGQQPQQAMPQQMMPQQMQAPQHQHPQHAMIPHPQAQAAMAQPQPPRPKPAPDAVINRADLETGVLLLNSAIQSQTPPEKAADAAAQTLPRPMLRALARRKPEKVHETLLAAGLLQGDLGTPAGAEYLAAFLIALRSRLSGPAMTGTPQGAQGG